VNSDDLLKGRRREEKLRKGKRGEDLKRSSNYFEGIKPQVFQLNNLEKNELVANCDRFHILKHSSAFPLALCS
jgi:hypothetical protein